MRLLHAAVVLALATAGFADTITLRDGSVVTGTYLGGNARQVRVETGDRIQTLDVSNIARIEFISAAPARAAEPVAPAPERQILRTQAETRPEPAPAPRPGGSMELPAGTNVVIRMIDGVDSSSNTVGQTFTAATDEAVVVNGYTVIPRGADAVVKLVDSKESGKLTGRAELTLNLVSVKVDGRVININTETVSRESESRGGQTAKVAGGTAALGAIIGALAGGGKGAAIGAVAGAGAGAGAQVLLKGQQVKIPSETRLTFVLDTPVRI